MTLMGVILRKVASLESVGSARRYPSPPPEPRRRAGGKRRRRNIDKFSHVRAKVDSSPPPLDPAPLWRRLVDARRNSLTIYRENTKLLMAIRRTYFTGGKVDSRWRELPRGNQQYYYERVNALKRIERENHMIYKLINTSRPKVLTSKQLSAQWAAARADIIARARLPFVLFPRAPRELMEDAAFAPPPGVHRPRVWLPLRVEGGAALGALRVELFAEACPRTCALFLELLRGEAGFTYAGTRFFRKVPHLYWSGGDVARDSGRGCYAPRGRLAPLRPENYHFTHSMPGLLSMRVTADDEVCGIFNITFKPLPQLDLRNVVFGRVIRPSATLAAIAGLGSARSPRPVVRVAAGPRPPQKSGTTCT